MENDYKFWQFAILTCLIFIVALGIIIIALLWGMISRLKKCPEAPSTIEPKWLATEIFFINHSIKIKGGISMVQAEVDQTFKATWPGPVDKYGNPANLQEGSVTFSSDDEEVATIEADPETGTYSATIKTHQKTGATAVRIKAKDADGDDLEGVLAVEVVAGDAVGFAEPTTTTPVDDEDEN
jgi:hypothetical protein